MCTISFSSSNQARFDRDAPDEKEEQCSRAEEHNDFHPARNSPEDTRGRFSHGFPVSSWKERRHSCLPFSLAKRLVSSAFLAV